MSGCTINNGQRVTINAIPLLSQQDFSDFICKNCSKDAHISAFFGVPEQSFPESARLTNAKSAQLRIFAVLALQSEGKIALASHSVDGTFPSLTQLVPSLHLFERAIFEQYGATPQGHPWLKPVRFPHAAGPRAGDMRFYSISGEEVHEVAVGPVHAGVIEPGHFRFQCLGETVMHLEISLGYQHRGIEEALIGGPNKTTFPIMENVAGDTSIGHTWAACSLAEGLAGVSVSPRAQMLRAALLEIERMANHTGDLGALSGDVGFLPTASYCGRIRGDFLNMTAVLCGNRFGRNIVRPGGCVLDTTTDMNNDLIRRIRTTYRDVKGAAKLLFDSTQATSRMMGIGVVSQETAFDLCLVGPAARASNIRLDTRKTHPLPELEKFIPHLCVETTGDVQARARVRLREVRESAHLAARLLEQMPCGETHVTMGQLAPASLAVSLVEGWRGEICHTALTDDAGRFFRYAITDPSFHNWMGLSLAMREGSISDFPLCNKSFNLSYCGHDL